MEVLRLKKKIGEDTLIGNGFIFPSGKVIVEWDGKIKSLVVYENKFDFYVINEKAVFRGEIDCRMCKDFICINKALSEHGLSCCYNCK